jgi:hypothetical protein
VAETLAAHRCAHPAADDPAIFIALRDEASVRAEAVALEASTEICRASV